MRSIIDNCTQYDLTPATRGREGRRNEWQQLSDSRRKPRRQS
jgi:hypothetical protein